MAGTTLNPLATERKDSAVDDSLSPKPTADEGRVNIKDVLADSRAHRGVNEMCITLLKVFVGFTFLGQLADETFTKNNVQLKEWALPKLEDIKDATTTAAFAHRWYSRLLGDPIVDGHNRALMAYLGTAGTTGSSGSWAEEGATGTWPDEECELGSMFPDSSGNIQGHYPSEPGKEYPFESYRLPCMRQLHYMKDDYHEDDADFTEVRGGTYGTSHFSDPVLMGKYNFSAVLHWHNHDYPLIYAASLKRQNMSHVEAAIEQVGAFIAQQDPTDIRMGCYLYNPATKTVAEVELQISRTYGTSHRKASVLINTFAATGRSTGYWLWGSAICCCFIVSLAQHARTAWAVVRYRSVYRRVPSDYIWKRWRRREHNDMDDIRPRGSLCCEMTNCCCCCPCFKGQFSGWRMLATLSVLVQFINCMLIGRSLRGVNQSDGPTWKLLPPANSAESLADQAAEWGHILQEGKSARPGTFDIHTHLIVTGCSNLLLVVLLLRDLSWHDGVGVLANTLSFASKDLQDIAVMTSILILAFGSFGTAVFGSFGSQDLFATLGVSMSSLSLLGFGKQLGYDEIVSDSRGIRFAGVGMGPLGGIKPIIFWVLLGLFVFVIPNIILAVIVEGFERHVDVANQRIKVTLFQLLRRRVFLFLWRFRDASLTDRPKWARQLALAGSPIGMVALDGLLNPASDVVLPVEIRESYMVSRDAFGGFDDEIEARRAAKELERRFFYQIKTADDLQALLRFAVEASSGMKAPATAAKDDEISTLAQGIWQLYSRDSEGKGWAENVEEDHSEDPLLGGGGNHIRAVVRNELRPFAKHLESTAKQLDDNSKQLEAVQLQLTSTKQQLATLVAMVQKLGDSA